MVSHGPVGWQPNFSQLKEVVVRDRGNGLRHHGLLKVFSVQLPGVMDLGVKQAKVYRSYSIRESMRVASVIQVREGFKRVLREVR